MRRRVSVAVLVSVVVAVLAACLGSDGSRAGVGLTYEGRFYWSSGQEVSARALGDVLETDVPFQSTEVDVRRIVGLDPDDFITARLLGIYPPGQERWELLAVDEEVAADPRSHPRVAAVLAPTG